MNWESFTEVAKRARALGEAEEIFEKFREKHKVFFNANQALIGEYRLLDIQLTDAANVVADRRVELGKAIAAIGRR